MSRVLFLKSILALLLVGIIVGCGSNGGPQETGPRNRQPQNIEANRDRADTCCVRALACIEDRDFDGAITQLNEAIRLDPNYAEAYRVRGVANREKGNLDQAIVDYSEAIRLDPKNAGYYYGRSVAYTDPGRAAGRRHAAPVSAGGR